MSTHRRHTHWCNTIIRCTLKPDGYIYIIFCAMSQIIAKLETGSVLASNASIIHANRPPINTYFLNQPEVTYCELSFTILFMNPKSCLRKARAMTKDCTAKNEISILLMTMFWANLIQKHGDGCHLCLTRMCSLEEELQDAVKIHVELNTWLMVYTED